MRIYLALWALAFAAVAAKPRNPQRIVGGSTTTIQQYPSVVALLYTWDLSQFWQSCGGSIINSRNVLTAAHCLVNHAVSRWRVRVGSSYANSGGTTHDLYTYIIHADYDRLTLDNDIAIVRTATSITFNTAAQPANIAGANYILGDDEVVWAAGWGAIEVQGPSSETLRHVQVWTVNQATCKSRYATLGLAVTDNMLCSGWLDVGGRDQCQGDSGGPLYHNNVVVGICSWGEECALSYFPGVNVRVSRYTSWIVLNS